MILLLQSETDGEVLYPYLAAHLAGSKKINQEGFDFIDLNNNQEIDKTNYSRVYVFISWVSIQSYDNNILKLIEVVERLSSCPIHILCDDEEILKILSKYQQLVQRIYGLSKCIDDHDLLNLKSNYKITSPRDYLFSIFLDGPSLPIALSYKSSKRLHYRDLKMVEEEISFAFSYWGVTSFVIEDSKWLEDREFISRFLETIKSTKEEIRWLILAGIKAEVLSTLNLLEMEKEGCRGISVELSSSDVKTIKLPELKNFNITAYIKIENNIRYSEVLFIFRTLFLSTFINHYYYKGKRSSFLNFICLASYLLSLTINWRFFRITSRVKFTKNNGLKLILKLRRLFK